jgi:protein gp37
MSGKPIRPSVPEIKLLLRIRQLRKLPAGVVKLNTNPLMLKVNKTWEILEISASGSVACY